MLSAVVIRHEKAVSKALFHRLRMLEQQETLEIISQGHVSCFI